MPKYEIDESRQIAIIWDICEIQMERPDLDDEEAMKVLLYAEDKHDANEGLTWDDLFGYANCLFPLLDVPVSEQEKCNCSHCRFNASIIENKCHKYDPNLSPFEKEYYKMNCRNYEEGTSTETQEMALECSKCQKSEEDCFSYKTDADGNCRNLIPQQPQL